MNDMAASQIDAGTAYGLTPATYKQHLVEVGGGTPMGELMRRYWQPCFISEELTSDKPQKVRLLGEDLILFRDKSGRPGLVHEHCCHRGSSLYYGRIEEDGIRCCYHGWKFDVKGHCLDQPAEVDGGRNRERIRQPWYPVEERYGLVYAYMGPPEKKPILPRWKHLEDLREGQIFTALGKTGYGPHDGSPMQTMAFNWLQSYENSMDAPHVPWLHYFHSGDQFVSAEDTRGLAIDEGGAFSGAQAPPYAFIQNLSAAVVADRTPLGVKQGVPFPGPDGRFYLASNEAIVPNVIVIFGAIDLMYNVPIDDTHFHVFVVFKEDFKGQRSGGSFYHGGKMWWELTAEEHQRFPGDYESQSSIGAVPAHNREHLVQGDAPIGMLRRRLEEAVRDVAEGRDPPGVSFAPDSPPLVTSAHNMIPYEPAG